MKRITSMVLVLLAAFTAFAGEDVIRRGAAISGAKPTPLADVIKNPTAFTGKDVVVEGVVEKVCTKMGCWMELTAEKSKPGIRVSFEDFVVPTTSAGMNARAEGVVKIKTLTKDEAEHLEHDGATVAKNEDGTAKDVTFHAKGVELKK
ncbi:MAG TPA: DUF4920 domain-containing protein [Thermoanaerobaculia bacterium]|nr:DUF4920 domain-containing protein [Thermoanaerobaculia bacterium]